MIVWLYWAASLTIVTYASILIVRRLGESGYAGLVSFYTVYLAASQILATRIVLFDLGFTSFYAPAAVFIYPFIAQAIDMVNEVYGRLKAHMAILICFITQVLLVAFIGMANSLQPAPFFQYEEAWRSLFGLSVRITAASWISFLACQNLDAYIFSVLKRRFERIVVLRSVASDIIDLTVDSVIFVTLAFYGVAPVIPLIAGQIASKNIVGFLDTPWFIWYKRALETSRVRSQKY